MTCFTVFGKSDKIKLQKDVYLFSYFKGNGEDGLHLAYSYDGMKWKALNDDKSFLTPMVANDKLMRDPCIVKGPDGTFHMVWTVSWKDRGIGYCSSKDLIHWTKQKFIPIMTQEPGALNCWAPEIFFDKKTNQYVIFWATTIPGRFPETEKSGDDNKYDHRIYYVTTKDFKNFSEAKLLYNKGFSAIDATIADAGNQIVMFVKDETRYPPQKNIRISTASSVFGPYSMPSKPITGNYWAEGPTSINLNGAWIVYFDKYTQGKYGAVCSTDLVNWEDISDQIEFPKGVRHGTVLKVSNKFFV
ncbi:MAG: glycoside hydrolase family 43 protein, partial [Bacteroidota bacterium]|nr:glycoside hydrolase family 43 protein [Bacteroidota bacterium]